ncbi:hypothetical protein [Oceanisphaera sp. W20_SRM_FM3]|uniref:hypothetical protein n=1 Tax=Oceanisphaera sp. W20_SRM_FM3 TaxID=3240267 RepID=UPI003F9755D4
MAIKMRVLRAATLGGKRLTAKSLTAMAATPWLLGCAALGLIGCFDDSGEPPKIEPEAQMSAQVQTSAAQQANTNSPQLITPSELPPSLCHTTWYQAVEDDLNTSDGQGHGPDLGSAEWRSVVEFKLNIRDDSELPQVETDAWCRYIDEHYLQTQD